MTRLVASLKTPGVSGNTGMFFFSLLCTHKTRTLIFQIGFLNLISYFQEKRLACHGFKHGGSSLKMLTFLTFLFC